MNFYLGRFQIFHLGHLDGLKQLKKYSNNYAIGLGSSQITKSTFKNPFDAKQRISMIRLIDNDIKIIEIPDFVDDLVWRQYILEKTPNLKYIFSENDYVLRLFAEKKQKIKRNLDISTTNIKYKIINDQPWQHLVPKQIYKYFLTNKLDQIIKKLQN